MLRADGWIAGRSPSAAQDLAGPLREPPMTGARQTDALCDADPLPQAASLLHVFASFGYGGVPIRMSRIINDLGERYRHDIIALDGCNDSRSRIDPELAVRYREVDPAKGNPLRAVLRARSTISALRPDLVMTYNWGAVEWAMAAGLVPGCRQIHCESGFGVEEANGQVRRRVLFRRLALRQIDRLIVPSETLVEIARTYWRVDDSKIAHIPNGVAVERFAAPPDRRACAEIGLVGREGRLLVGTAAPLRPEKNVARLLRAFALLPEGLEADLAILGDGAERPALTALAAELGIAERVIFTGHVEALERVLGALDLFALSSDTEQMPNSLIQAMAAGLPVAATAVGDVARILPESNRPYLAAADGGEGLAEVMGRLLADAPLRASLGRDNRERVRRHYDERLMLERYRAILRDCLPGRR